jgi:RNA polymerase sigma factor (TIGR02999 family)
MADRVLLTEHHPQTILRPPNSILTPESGIAVGDPLSHNITHLLKQWSGGDQRALETLTPLVYEELRKQATCYLRRERRGHTLQTTALINEAYLRLIDVKDVQWQSRAHFFAIAANLMRRILVDHARQRNAGKRGGSHIRIPLDEAMGVTKETDVELLAIDEALDRLAAVDPQQARVVELRFFSGLTIEETAAALNISTKTVTRDWSVARAWLRREIIK